MSKALTRPFRFGVVCPLTSDLRAWRDGVRRIADSIDELRIEAVRGEAGAPTESIQGETGRRRRKVTAPHPVGIKGGSQS